METTLVKPDWLRIKPSSQTSFAKIKSALKKRGLVTVCEEAQCPNMSECWHNEGTATFMVMGDTCTRGCAFCAIKTAKQGQPLDAEEPQKIASAIREMGLDYAVLTSVDRDELEDQGAGHFSQCIQAIRQEHPQTYVEVLIPDFRGEDMPLKKVIFASPHVIAHNVETVERLQRRIRDYRAGYWQSINLLKKVKEVQPNIITKSALMVGLGESQEEVIQAMKDLRSVNCDVLTIGQYLKPKEKRLQVVEYVHPDVFRRYEKIGKELGFKYIAAGPFVRSSYKAGELFIANIIRGEQH